MTRSVQWPRASGRRQRCRPTSYSHIAMRPHADSARLSGAICKAAPLAGPWNGDLFRFCRPGYSTPAELLSGKGALFAGGRWHPIGLFRAVYLSLDPETALAESMAHHRRYGWPERSALPKTLIGIAARLQTILDLTDGRVRRRIRLSEERILAERWWERRVHDEEAVTQAVGRVAREAGVEGLLVPSAAFKRGKNMVLFSDNLAPGSELAISNPGELPSHRP
jgi:RES domain-containing protein